VHSRHYEKEKKLREGDRSSERSQGGKDSRIGVMRERVVKVGNSPH